MRFVLQWYISSETNPSWLMCFWIRAMGWLWKGVGAVEGVMVWGGIEKGLVKFWMPQINFNMMSFRGIGGKFGFVEHLMQFNGAFFCLANSTRPINTSLVSGFGLGGDWIYEALSPSRIYTAWEYPASTFLRRCYGINLMNRLYQHSKVTWNV